MRSNIAIATITVILLTVIIFILFNLHNSTDQEIVSRFNAQQITATNQFTIAIKNYLSEQTRNVAILSSLTSLQSGNREKIDSEIQSYYKNLKKNNVRAISIYNSAGTIMYSTTKEVIGHNYSESEFFQWAKKAENKGKQYISSLIQKSKVKNEPLPYFRFLIVSPIYQGSSGNNKFSGIVTETIDLKDLVTAILPSISPNATKENVWILDRSGTLLFHSRHSEMVLKNIKDNDGSCLQCHSSFSYLSEILIKNNGNFKYNLKDNSDKLASYASINFNNISWILILDLPSEDVTGFLTKHQNTTLLLTGLIIVTLLIGSYKIFQSNQLKEKAKDYIKRLKEQNRINLILENAVEGIILLDQKGNHTFVNKAASDLLRYTDGELLGRHSHSLWHHSHKDCKAFSEEDCPIYKTLKDGITHSGEEYFWNKQGLCIPVDFSTKPIIEDGIINGAVVIFREITDRKNAQKAKQQQLDFANALNQIANIILESNESQEIIEKTTDILGKVLLTDRLLIYNVNFATNQLTAYSEWLNPDYLDIKPTKGVYSVDVFRNGLMEMMGTKHYFVSHSDDRNPIIVRDKSDKILHDIMEIKSALWYPFLFQKDKYYLLVLNDTHKRRDWTEEEIDFLNSVSKQVSLAIEKINLTEEKNSADMKIKESEIKYRTVADYTYDWEYWENDEGEFVYISPSCERITGYTQNEFIADPSLLEKIIIQEDIELFTAHHKCINYLQKTNDQVEEIEFRIITKENVVVNIHHVCRPIFDINNKYVGRRVTNRDITKQKMAELSLIENEIKYRELVENAPDAIAIYIEGKIVFVNNECVKLMAAKNEEELLGKSVISFVHPDSRELVIERMKKGTVTGAVLPRVEERFIRADGTAVIVEVKAMAIMFEHKPAVQLIINDITDRKAIELEIIKAKEKAESASRVKDGFITNMSHEIRTPLNGILGLTSIIKDTFSQYITDAEKPIFDGIETSSSRIIRTVDMILNFSRLQSGDFPISLKELNISDLCKHLVQEFTKAANAASLSLSFQNNINEEILFADKYSVSQSLSYLIDNAIKYTESGFVKVILNTGTEGEILVKIMDSGIGISSDYLEHIFEPFRQEDMGYGRAYEGVGLGLSLTKKLLELNNAKIEVESKKGEGTTFTIKFNKVKSMFIEKSIVGTPFVKTSKPDTLKKPMVLIVEDDAINQIAASGMLHKTYDTIIVSSSDEVNEVLNKNKIDIILMDISINGSKNGLELTEEIKATNEHKHIPIIVVTAHAFEIDRLKALSAGCNEYLPKPFTKKMLIEKIEKFI